MIHLILRLPVAYQRTLCRTLHDYYRGEFVAWFADRTSRESPCYESSEDLFTRHYLSEVGYGKFFRALLADKDAVIILGGWSSPMTNRTLLFAKLLRRPIFIWADHPHARPRGRLFTFLRRMYLRLVSRIAAGFLACGQPTIDHLTGLGIPASAIVNFPYWVEVPARWSVPA